jgi:hypothetical protein
VEEVDLTKIREERRRAAIMRAFQSATALALSDWDMTVIVGVVGDGIEVICPTGRGRFELVGILTAAAQKVSLALDPGRDAE